MQTPTRYVQRCLFFRPGLRSGMSCSRRSVCLYRSAPAGRANFLKRGCGLTAERLFAREAVRVRFPAAAPFRIAAPPYRYGGGSTSKALVSKTRSCRRDTCPPCGAAMCFDLHVGPWLDKEGTCLASRLMREHYPPAPPFFANSMRRGRRGRLGGLISRFKRVRFPFPQPSSSCGPVDR